MQSEEVSLQAVAEDGQGGSSPYRDGVGHSTTGEQGWRSSVVRTSISGVQPE